MATVWGMGRCRVLLLPGRAFLYEDLRLDEAVVEADCDKIASSLYGNSRPTILYSSGFPLKTRAPFCRIPERRYLLSSTQVVEDVACTVCGCVCDDLRITVERGRITQAHGACHLSRTLASRTRLKGSSNCGDRRPPVACEVAAKRSAEILVNARYPLIYGLSAAVPRDKGQPCVSPSTSERT